MLTLVFSFLQCLVVFPGGFESGFEMAAIGFGGSGGGQTREHAQLAKSLGVEQIAIVVSKLDTCDYSRVRLIDYLNERVFEDQGFGVAFGPVFFVYSNIFLLRQLAWTILGRAFLDDMHTYKFS